MKYIQDENILKIIAGIIFCGFLIWWIRSGDIKESKKLEEEGLEMNSITKMRSWRVYIIAGIGLIVFLFEVLKRLYLYFTKIFL
ncbi:hypothetical protein SAMN05444671_3977 [Flavobacterium sp. CF108]|uniref:hypothetical protein n=1 Tax=unclassified Flavobacterium TaxID=196869 RepID=UPI0008BC91A5|nr:MULTISPECIES: hypothetical protein [unclassified Flavobacterium]SEO93295.1 hypothetical protein SAMN04487978_3995 [Flavobacterium sp. fv08]SHH83663.1 hypothetical protein SAMN05444671_3977 [Flavobacterium sp. CF108]